MTSNEKLLDERIREALNYVSKTQAIPNTEANRSGWGETLRTSDGFLRAYSPCEARNMFCIDKAQKSLKADAPTLTEVGKRFGGECLETWMQNLLTDLSLYMGYAGTPNTVQIKGIIQVLLRNHPNMRVTELLYYFECIKEGKYYHATIKLEPTSLVKGLCTFVQEVNITDEYANDKEGKKMTDEYMRNLCTEFLYSGLGVMEYDLEALALLFGRYYRPTKRDHYLQVKEKILRNNSRWVCEFINLLR